MVVPDQDAQGAIIKPGQGRDLRPLPHAVPPQWLDTGIVAALDRQPAPAIRPSIRKTFNTGRSIPSWRARGSRRKKADPRTRTPR